MPLPTTRPALTPAQSAMGCILLELDRPVSPDGWRTWLGAPGSDSVVRHIAAALGHRVDRLIPPLRSAVQVLIEEGLVERRGRLLRLSAAGRAALS